jgi:hypothetical protein
MLNLWDRGQLHLKLWSSDKHFLLDNLLYCAESADQPRIMSSVFPALIAEIKQHQPLAKGHAIHISLCVAFCNLPWVPIENLYSEIIPNLLCGLAKEPRLISAALKSVATKLTTPQDLQLFMRDIFVAAGESRTRPHVIDLINFVNARYQNYQTQLTSANVTAADTPLLPPLLEKVVEYARMRKS